MAIITFKDFNFKFDKEDKNVLSEINMEIKQGDFVLLCGPSGSGKTTLLSSMKKEIRPTGVYNGKICYNGVDIEKMDDKQSACDIGFLFQNPEDQLVSDNVIQELSFSLENIGLNTVEIRNRVAEMAAFFGLDKYLYKNTNELSGGQKQLVNLCSLLVLKPKLLLLDEPTSQLDPIAAHDFLSILRRLNEEFSITIIITEHKIDNVFPMVDRTIFLEEGSIKYMNNARQISSKASIDPIFAHYLPSVTKIHFALKNKYRFLDEVEIPITIREGRKELIFLQNKLKEFSNESLMDKHQIDPLVKKLDESNSSEIFDTSRLLKCEDIWFGYIKDNLVLKGISFEIKQGEFISILGGNGTGKTTLLRILSGLITPKKGKLNFKKDMTIAYVNQNPMIHFSQQTVDEELSLNSLNLHQPTESPNPSFLKKFFVDKLNNEKFSTSKSSDLFISENERKRLIDLFNLSRLLNKHPYDCSGGEKQKIAIVKSLLINPDILFLDEPTKGLDPLSKLNLANILKELQNTGLTIVMSTHDIDFAAEYSERCMMLFDGAIQIDNIPKTLFSNNSFYTTFVNRTVKNYLPEAITLKDVKDSWLG
ncbi:ABC transporter ATP-binding protein [Methanobacterium alcaliphilum]|uniref:ABC transporter ATP-binding protein n=1 Tax=Methanobacterium alcaliphilum TaxID=392018 RepID=UPI002009E114|nr:ATP-binding cassette domain-containing protein [Methanobacterium alcaliphilum]MCK9151480.1 ATP-binding cassette domain-containing protein [Methanobacterium alcaliphilum]